MKLNITDAAHEQLKLLQIEEYSYLRLYYDTEGMGCGVNGLPTIRLTNNYYDKTDERVENEQYSVIIDHQQATFFRKEMKLDFIKNTFRLSSPEGVLNPIIPTVSVKKEAVL
ncbi:iron-sulfur cluster biosynthesis family protein [Halobacillus sp. A1]|uniref:iron-sulfur cluster biosynthesis family protein n=1 Tax=Halobacillus sp. A1 TaxID=2880262 RepID=UPI0020A6BB4D|nr:iron-sulfur cluster biosynthesis family protein [Halobacillus sp. A1]